jgi:hypothetical protein
MIAGSLRAILQNAELPTLVETQLAHLIEILTDAEDFSWPVLRQFHGMVLQDLELARYSWFDQDVIAKKKLKHVARAEAISRRQPTKQFPQQNRPFQNSYQGQNNEITVICKLYNTGECHTQSPHMTPEGMARHACNHCKRSIDRYFSHPENTAGEKVKIKKFSKMFSQKTLKRGRPPTCSPKSRDVLAIPSRIDARRHRRTAMPADNATCS